MTDLATGTRAVGGTRNADSGRVAGGVMCGTSADGIDAVLIEIHDDPAASSPIGPSAFLAPAAPVNDQLEADTDCRPREVRLLAHHHSDFPPPLHERLLALSDPRGCSLLEMARLHAELGHLFADALLEAQGQSGEAGRRLAVIGSPGYTAAHVTGDPLPTTGPALTGLRSGSQVTAFPLSRDGPSGRQGSERTFGATLALGDGDILATRTRVPVLCDMRAADRALGGQGAPLVPWADTVLLRPLARRIGAPVVALNLGGIANLTLVPPHGPPAACDTGPGNMLLDLAVAQATDGRELFDAGGRRALAGHVSQGVLDQLLAADEFLAQPPPKSTGRERYGATFLDRHAHSLLQLALADRLATLAAFTVEAVALALAMLPGVPPSQVIVSGGGAFNQAVLARLSTRLAPAQVLDSQQALGLHPQSREALAFALMADASLRGEPCTLPAITGASRSTCLGKLCLPATPPRSA